MVNMTVSIPNNLKHKMDTFPEINWSAVARKAFLDKISDMEFIKEFKSKSTMTEEDAIKLGRKVNTELAKHYN